MRRRLPFIVAVALVLVGLTFVLLFWSEDKQERKAPLAATTQPLDGSPGAIMPESGEEERESVLPSTSFEQAWLHNERGALDFKPLEAPGWHIFGEVKKPDGTPIEGAQVSFIYNPPKSGFGIDAEPATSTITSVLGRFHVEVSLSAGIPAYSYSRSFPGGVLGYARAPGHEPAYKSTFYEISLPDPYAKDSALRIDFTLKPGAVLRGRVLKSDGSPVYRAGVSIKPQGKDWKWNRVDDSGPLTDPTGCYAIPIEEAGAYFIAAAKMGEGTASIGPFHLDPATDFEVPDIVLLGRGVLAGTVAYPDGTPVREILVFAFSESVRGDFRTICSYSWIRPKYVDGPEGIPYGWTVTDQHGRFRFNGLRTGHYVMNLEQTYRGETYGPFETGEEGLWLVADIHRFQGVVRDEQGRLVANSSIGIKTKEGYERSMNTNGGVSEWVTVSPGTIKVTGKKIGRNREFFSPDSKDITIAEGVYETRVELVLTEAPEHGKVRLLVIGEEDEPIPSVLAIFTDQSNDQIQYFKNDRNDEGEILFDVPPGYYKLTVYERLAGSLGSGKYVASDLKNVGVVSGQETSLVVRLRTGGWLRLTLHVTGEANSLSDLKIKAVTEDKSICHWLSEFVPAGGGKKISVGGLIPDTPYRSFDRFHDGFYTLKVSADGFTETEVVFTIVSGTESEVDVWLRSP